MAKRKNPAKPAEAAASKPPTKAPRRRRRRSSGAKSQPTNANLRGSQQEYVENKTPFTGHEMPPTRLSRAPRPADLPPNDPNVFSYTYTIWKSS